MTRNSKNQQKQIMPIIEWIRMVRQMLRSRYVRALEDEIARLRAENIALLNSLLGTAGVPPLRIERAPAAGPFTAAEIACATGARMALAGDSKKAQVAPAFKLARFGSRNGGVEKGGAEGAGEVRASLKAGTTQAEAGTSLKADATVAGNVPLRRRSWQQIGRMLEIEEARREREHAAQVAEIRERWTAENPASPVEPSKH